MSITPALAAAFLVFFGAELEATVVLVEEGTESPAAAERTLETASEIAPTPLFLAATAEGEEEGTVRWRFSRGVVEMEVVVGVPVEETMQVEELVGYLRRKGSFAGEVSSCGPPKMDFDLLESRKLTEKSLD